MQKIGIIAEYNPFHNGHLYQIKKIKEQFPNSTIIVVLGGNFSQRGIPSIVNKWEKTKSTLNYVDLVVELPFPFATQSADIFAKGAIQILKELKVNYLAFGSESNDLTMLTKLAESQINNHIVNQKTKQYLKSGTNYPTALSKALQDHTHYQVKTPNDLLAISYLKELIKQKANIIPLPVKRTNDYHSLILDSSITSATSIRNAIKEKQDVTNYLPNSTLFHQPIFLNDFFPLLKYKIMTEKDLSIYQTVDEGIEQRLKKKIIDATSMEELIQQVKTKRYTYNKINRMLIHILTGFTKEEANQYQTIPYIRILGFNQKGKTYLKECKTNVTIPIITNFMKNNPLLELELRVTAVYASVLDEQAKKALIKQEYQQKPIQV